MRRPYLFLLTLFLSISILEGATLIVDDDIGVDDGNSPFATITAAIASAVDNDIISVTGGADQIHTEANIVVDNFAMLTIEGQGMYTTIIQAAATENAGMGRVFSVGTVINQTINLTLRNMTIRHGDISAGGGGGGILLERTSTLGMEKCFVTKNRYTGSGGGGGILSEGTLIMEDCVIEDNSVNGTSDFLQDSFGGGIYASLVGGDDLDINRCSFISNEAIASGDLLGGAARGGGLYIASGGDTSEVDIVIASSTFSGNRAQSNSDDVDAVGGGLGVSVTGINRTIDLTLVHLTFTENEVAVTADGDTDGGALGVLNFGTANLNITNSIFANSIGDQDVDFLGAGNYFFLVNDNNLAETCGTACPSFTYTFDPQLQPLVSCEFTKVHQLPNTSLAVDAGTFTGSTTTDQCFGTRFGAPDLGAIETTTPLFVPVDLVRFSARLIAKKVYLDWQTASESNNAGFVVEKSFTANQWEEIGFVKGQINSTDPRDYHFMDEHPSQGINYYRLKQLDLDATFEYSDVVAVVYSNANRSVAFFPNPVSDGNSNLAIQSDRDERLNIRIYNLQGQLQIQIQQEIVQGENVLPVQVPIVAGIYFVVVSGRQLQERFKVVVE